MLACPSLALATYFKCLMILVLIAITDPSVAVEAGRLDAHSI